MSVTLPPNSTGQTVDTVTTVAGKERGVTVPPNGGQFALYHLPAATAQATVTQPAGAAGVKNVCTGVSFTSVTVGTAQTIISVSLRDGATGAGTILWSMQFIQTTNQVLAVHVPLPHIAGTAATAMTFEFSAGGVAASVQSVSMQGYTTA